MNDKNFPEKWRIIKLGDCCKIISGSTPSRKEQEYWGNDIPWATPKDLSQLDNSILEDTIEYISEKGYKSCSTKLLPKGTILFSSRAPIGLVGIAGKEMCTNQGFKNLVPSKEIYSKYLYYCMKKMSHKIADMGNGATFKEVSKSVMHDIEIPIPPISEQKRIAAILDKADAIRRKRQQAIQLADEFLRSVFLDMFGDPVTNPKGWPIGTIRDIVSEVKYGTSKKADEFKGKYPILRMNNITFSGDLDLNNLKYIDLEEKEKDKYLVKKGDLLFNRTNSKELVGKTAVFNQDKKMALAGYLIRVRSNNKSNPHYISAYLNSKHGKVTLLNMCKSIIGMANINAQELQDIKILIPPIKLQEKYAKVVEKVGNNQEKLDRQLDESVVLFNSLTQRAFRGEL